MGDDVSIRVTIRTYSDCVHESSADTAREAFHEHAEITGYLDQGLHETSVDEYAGFVASRQPSALAESPGPRRQRK